MKKAYKISELSTLLKRGITPSYTDELKVMVINQKCIRDYKLNLDLARYTDPEKKKIADEKYLKSYDVLVNSTGVGTLGRVAQISEVNRPVTSDSHVTIVRPDDQTIDPLYFGYCLKSRQKHIEALGEGSTGQTELSRVLLGDMEIEILEDFREQKVVANFFKAIDDKIELNQQMNEILEDIAKTLFKSWFIDFDPVRAKAEGRPTGLSKEISDLFPDSFEDSEVGEIPKDWKIKKISDIFEVKKGSTPATKNTEFWEPEEHKWVSPRDLSQNPSIFLFDSARGISKVGLQKIRSGLLPDNTVMMSSRAPIGLLGISGINCALGTGIFAIPPKNIMSYGLTYFFVGNQIRKLKQLSIGSTFEEVSLKIFNNLMIVFPNDEILTATKNIFDDFFKKIKTNTLEIKTLTNIRDTLLPKLISGGLKISDAENLVEKAGI